MPKKETAPTKALATIDQTSTTALMAVAEGAQASDGRGKENLNREDTILPRLAIAQDLSPQVKAHEGAFIEGLKVGEMFNTLTNENYGQGPLEFVVLRVDKRAMQFDKENNVVDFNVPWNDPRCEFTDGENGERVNPIATRFYDYIVLLVPSHEMLVISLKRTQMPAAKRLNTFLQVRPGSTWMGKYKVDSFFDKKGKFTFGNFRINIAGPTSKETVAFAEECFKFISRVNVKVDQTGEEVEASASEQAAIDEKVPF